jgi:hypothetical protein
MSDISVLSHEYKRASELSQAINHALITLKKVHLRLPGGEDTTLDEFDASRRTLAGILATLITLLEPTRRHRISAPEAARVPEALVARLRGERRGDLSYYLDDLERIVGRLRDDPSKLSDADLALLDQLAAMADAETSSVFRLLMRK